MESPVLHLLRKLVAGITSLFFRFDVEGQENIPKGGALLVANHISLLDPFFILTTIPRLVFFVMSRKIYEYWLWHWFMKRINMIPIDGGTDKEGLELFNETCQSMLNAGKMICIFPEGQISRVGQLLRFKKGIEHIASGIEVPIVPIQIEAGEKVPLQFRAGSGDTVGFTWRSLRQKITINIGRPVPPETSAFHLRQSVMELNASTFQRRFKEYHTLNYFFWKATGADPGHIIYRDQNQEITFRQFRNQVYHLSRWLAETKKERLIVLRIKKCYNWLLLNVATALAGKTVMNLDPNDSMPGGFSGLVIGEGGIDPDDILRKLPDREVRKRAKQLNSIDRNNRVRGDTPVLKVISGSEEQRGAVTLSHSNILATYKGLSNVYTLREQVRMLGLFPPHISYGYILDIWMPIFLKATIHYPEQTKPEYVIEAVRKYNVNVLVAHASLVESIVRTDQNVVRQLTHILTGQDRVELGMQEWLQKRYDIRIRESTGLVEFGVIIAVNTPGYRGKDVTGQGLEQEGTRPGTAGRSLPGLAVKIAREENLNVPCEENETGMLLIKGAAVPLPHNMEADAGYHREWLVTGLLARIDADGFIEIVS